MKSSAIELAKKRHAHMVDDPLRTGPLLQAIRKTVKKSDIVLDIGTGTGVLAIAAVKAGAKAVIAVDCDEEALEAARRKAKTQGMTSKITFVHGLSFVLSFLHKCCHPCGSKQGGNPVIKKTMPSSVLIGGKTGSPIKALGDDIPKADVIICETVGSFAYDENILATLADAKERLAKRGGRFIPCRLELWGAPISRIPKGLPKNEIARINKASIMSKPRLIHSTDFHRPFKNSIHVKCSFDIAKVGVVKAFAVWPKAFWSRKFWTDASPFAKPTHWKQGILPIKPRGVKKGGTIRLELIFTPHPEDPKKMTERSWKCMQSY